MVWLLMIVIIPFATRLISGTAASAPGSRVYAVIQVLTMLTFLLMARHIRSSDLLRPGAPAAARDDVVLLTVAALFALSIPVAFATQWAFALWVASVPAARAVGRRRDRTATTTAAAAATTASNRGSGAHDHPN